MTMQIYAVVIMAFMSPAAAQGDTSEEQGNTTDGYTLNRSWTDGLASACESLGCATEEDSGTAGLAACQARCDNIAACNTLNFASTGADAATPGRCCLRSCAPVSDLKLSSEWKGWDVYVKDGAEEWVYDYYDRPGYKCTANLGYSLVTTMDECNVASKYVKPRGVDDPELADVCSVSNPCTEGIDRADYPPGCYGIGFNIFFNRNHVSDRGTMFDAEAKDGWGANVGYVCKIPKSELAKYDPGAHDSSKCRESGESDNDCCAKLVESGCADGYVKGAPDYLPCDKEGGWQGGYCGGSMTGESSNMCADIQGVIGSSPSTAYYYYSCKRPPEYAMQPAAASSALSLVPGLSALVALLGAV